MNSYAVDYSDVQGLLRFGYAALTEASFLLLRIRDARDASAWLASAPVTNAVKLDKAPPTARAWKRCIFLLTSSLDSRTSFSPACGAKKTGRTGWETSGKILRNIGVGADQKKFRMSL